MISKAVLVLKPNQLFAIFFMFGSLVFNVGNLGRLVGSCCLIAAFIYLLFSSSVRTRQHYIYSCLIFLIYGFTLMTFKGVNFSGPIVASSFEYISYFLSGFILLVPLFCSILSKDEYLKILHQTLNLVILIGLIDLLLRLQATAFGCFDIFSACRTAAKFGGLAFNSNIMAMLFVVSVFLTRSKIQLLVLILLFLSLSRAGMAALVLGFFIWALASLFRMWLVIPVATVAFVAGYFVLDGNLQISDGSFLTKIAFFNQFLIEFGEAPIEVIMFGDVFDYWHIVAKYSADGYSLHASILKTFWYFGLFGVFIWVFWYWLFMRASRRLFAIGCGLLALGMSGFPIFSPIFLVLYLEAEYGKS